MAASVEQQEAHKKSWDAFLDAYRELQTERKLLEGLCDQVFNLVNLENPKFANLKTQYQELIGDNEDGSES